MFEATPWMLWLNASARTGILPGEFWRLSVREWRALMRGDGAEMLSRVGFEALSSRFPDDKHG